MIHARGRGGEGDLLRYRKVSSCLLLRLSVLILLQIGLAFGKVNPCASISRFTLVNADEDTDIGDMPSTLYLAEYDVALNIRANVKQTNCHQPVKSVMVKYMSTSEKSHQYCEELAPYTIFQDSKRRTLGEVDLRKSNYDRHIFPNVTAVARIQATPFFADACKGTTVRGRSLRQNFRIVAGKQEDKPTPSPVSPPSTASHCAVGSVKEFVLLDANNKAVRVVSNNDTVCIKGKNWKIRAVTKPCNTKHPIGSVQLSYKGANKSFAATDNIAPFEFMLPIFQGNTSTVRIAATPFGQRNLRGRTGKTASIVLNLRNCLNITSDKCSIKEFRHDGKLLLNGDSFCRNAAQHMLQAVVSCPSSATLQKVVLQLHGAKHNVTTTERNAPYTVQGPAGVQLPVGTYMLQATPYTHDNTNGQTKMIRFSVVNCDAPTPAPQFTDFGRPTPAPQFTDYGRPTPAPQFTDYGRPTKAPSKARATAKESQFLPTPAPQFTDYERPTPS